MKPGTNLVSVNEARWRTLGGSRDAVVELAEMLGAMLGGRVDLLAFRGEFVACPEPVLAVVERIKI
jgi:hypothetical protein